MARYLIVIKKVQTVEVDYPTEDEEAACSRAMREAELVPWDQATTLWSAYELPLADNRHPEVS